MIYIVCNNANLKIDGIGDYAYRLYSEFIKIQKNVRILSAQSGKSGIIDKLFSMAMTKMLIGLIRNVKERDVVIIEYPFAECNILIIPVMFFLRNRIKKTNGIIVLSLHEYQRVSPYRKIIIKKIIKIADVVLVTNHDIDRICSHYGIKCMLRTIPSNIYKGEINFGPKDTNKYLFFGLLDKTKAFEEMIDAWVRFNADKSRKLVVISSSDIDMRYKDYGIEYYRNLEQEDISRHFMSAQFCILPIRPYVSTNNATYKTALCYECIQIGCFDTNIGNEAFSVRLNNYSVEGLLEGLVNSASLSSDDIATMTSMMTKVPKPSFNITVKQYVNAISSLTKK